MHGRGPVARLGDGADPDDGDSARVRQRPDRRDDVPQAADVDALGELGMVVRSRRDHPADVEDDVGLGDEPGDERGVGEVSAHDLKIAHVLELGEGGVLGRPGQGERGDEEAVCLLAQHPQGRPPPDSGGAGEQDATAAAGVLPVSADAHGPSRRRGAGPVAGAAGSS